MNHRLQWHKPAGMLLVAAVHGAALWALWQQRQAVPSSDRTPLFVNFIAPPTTTPAPEPRHLPPTESAAKEMPSPQQLAAEVPVPAPADLLPPPPPEPKAPPAIAPMPLPDGPMAIAGELSVACPERSAPAYPMSSRRMGETGTVVLHVELDERGQVAAAKVSSSSGYLRLDEAALNAIRAWRCKPATRNGEPVRATALQPFKFVLQGN